MHDRKLSVQKVAAWTRMYTCHHRARAEKQARVQHAQAGDLCLC